MIQKNLIFRSQIIDSIRSFFKGRDYLEVETPIINKHPGMEPHLDYFETEYVSKNGKEKEKLFLNHSPELWMKKLLGQGHERIFQVGKVFRNGERLAEDCESQRERPRNDDQEFYRLHHPEFTMLEWYQQGEDYEFMMGETEELVRSVGRTVQGLDRRMVKFIDQEWERISVREAFLKHAGIDLDNCRTLDRFRDVVEENAECKMQNAELFSWDDLFFWIMLNKVESHLGKERPTILYDYPASQAALARKKGNDTFWAERFEAYIDGVELCNSFSELCDPAEQRQRLIVEQEERRRMEKVVPEIDEEFLEALGRIGSASGNALGVDRLVMLLLGKRDIREVMIFEE